MTIGAGVFLVPACRQMYEEFEAPIGLWRAIGATTKDESAEGSTDFSFGGVFVDLTDPRAAAAAAQLKSADPETHLDLAIAYRQMGMTADALTEAGAALEIGASLGKRSHQALSILLDPKGLMKTLDETLAVLRAALFPD